VRRIVVTLVAGGFVIAATVLGTLSPAGAPTRDVTHRITVAARTSLPRYGGEPVLRPDSAATPAPWRAAVRFARDYAAWTAGRLTAIPAEDATERVILLLEESGRNGTGATADAVASVRMAPAGAHGYVVTSSIGNFLIGRRGSHWLVVSLPGD
jgi:hypothetical protein